MGNTNLSEIDLEKKKDYGVIKSELRYRQFCDSKLAEINQLHNELFGNNQYLSNGSEMINNQNLTYLRRVRK